MTDLPLSLYVHFPWCVAKCPYCDFNSHALDGELPAQAYVDALLRDLDFELTVPETRPLTSIFLGGGTPSLFPADAIGRFLDGVADRLALAQRLEVTLEANPGTVDRREFAGYRSAGVNRMSLGVQSLDDGKLRALGRIHDATDAQRAMDAARDAGFDNINLDLMYALPRQTEDEALTDLEGAIGLGPNHLSWYHLTLEPNTAFHARPPALPEADEAAAMQDAGEARLAAAGFQRYEVSAFARDDQACRHNLNYWTFGDYLGIGAGAHGKRTRAGTIRRRARQRHPRAYVASAGTAAAIQDERTVAGADLVFEFLLNGLRLDAGVSMADFEARTGMDAGVVAPAVAPALEQGWLERAGGRLRATAFGRAHLDTVLEAFLPADGGGPGGSARGSPADARMAP